MQQDINSKQHGTSFSKRDTVRKTIKTMEKGKTGRGIQWKRGNTERKRIKRLYYLGTEEGVWSG